MVEKGNVSLKNDLFTLLFKITFAAFLKEHNFEELDLYGATKVEMDKQETSSCSDSICKTEITPNSASFCSGGTMR